MIRKHRFHTAAHLHSRPFQKTKQFSIKSNIYTPIYIYTDIYVLVLCMNVIPERATREAILVLFGNAKRRRRWFGSDSGSEPRTHGGSSRGADGGSEDGPGGGEGRHFWQLRGFRFGVSVRVFEGFWLMEFGLVCMRSYEGYVVRLDIALKDKRRRIRKIIFFYI